MDGPLGRFTEPVLCAGDEHLVPSLSVSSACHRRLRRATTLLRPLGGLSRADRPLFTCSTVTACQDVHHAGPPWCPGHSRPHGHLVTYAGNTTRHSFCCRCSAIGADRPAARRQHLSQRADRQGAPRGLGVSVLVPLSHLDSRSSRRAGGLLERPLLWSRRTGRGRPQGLFRLRLGPYTASLPRRPVGQNQVRIKSLRTSPASRGG